MAGPNHVVEPYLLQLLNKSDPYSLDLRSLQYYLPLGVTVLLVDGDSTCLTIISKMLRRFGYKVMTAKRATDAFCIIRDGEYKIDLVLAEGCLPDMDKYELLETIKKMSKLPVVLMSVDYNGNAMLGCLFKGAMLYLVKPITMDDLKNLWQFAFIKGRENLLAVEEISGIEEESSLENASGVNVESQPLISEGRQNLQKVKRKRSDEMLNDEDDNDDSTAPKKPKLIWTNELHNRFLQAMKVLGIDGAHPKKILQHMNVPGLKKEHVSSHLQKYRLSLKQEQDAIQKTMNSSSTFVNVASHHVLSPFGLQEGFHQFSDMQSMRIADQPAINGLIQENLNGCLTIPSPDSAYLLKHVDSNHYDAPTTKFELKTQCIEQLDSAYPECNRTGDRVINNEGLVGFHQTGNSEQFLKAEIDLLNIGDSWLESLLHCPTLFDGSLLEKQQSVLPEPLQLPPPQDQEVHDNFGAERGRESDELFTTGKGTSPLFHYDDFDGFW
ncbi:two-component response regulator ARR2-like [Durio zibethinus]|uniref:Two-component response regulator ARR2-like n=1 Tax=Durio zibethinus TaxID=66656 RepID=A0A6P6AXB1_DURZI|nr:two-component response regulator ARR2-like [Durio zibethinus]